MKWIKNMTAGLIGAVALNILHEVVRKNVKNAPQINLLGEEVVNKTLSQVGTPVVDADDLHRLTLEADLIANATYYSMIGSSGKYIWPKAVALGLSAGIGAIQLPEPLGLDATPVTRTTQTKVLTVGYYLFGALVTATVLKTLFKS
ncbi:hypothetical protein [Pedobacter nanyangensis]|uniref:hypothetical protein n=1 Tax=Pedobacter nanyangensis TaxID=1562389 RepID=UPI000DE3ABB4|nr:hypothetical protein [Pedobacter nanyangensis]